MSILECPRYLINPAEMSRLQGEEASRRLESRCAVDVYLQKSSQQLHPGEDATLHYVTLSVHGAAVSLLSQAWLFNGKSYIQLRYLLTITFIRTGYLTFPEHWFLYL